MALTVNNVGTLTLLNILRKTSDVQEGVLERMATGSKINRGADDPAGMLALTKLDNELTAVNAGITNNQRTDAVLGVADNALTELGNLVDEIQRLSNESANDAALTSEEIAANQTQIDDALASIDRIVAQTNFNGKKLLDGSMGINHEVGTAGKVSDVKVYSRRADLDSTGINLTIDKISDASNAAVSNIQTGAAAASAVFSVQGNLGAVVINVRKTQTAGSTRDLINAAVNQTGVSAIVSGTELQLFSQETGSEAFVRTKVISGDAAVIGETSDTGVDAVVTVDGAATAVDGNHVNYSGNGFNVAFELTSGFAAGGSVTLTIRGDGDGKSGATFQLGTNSETRSTIGIDGVYSAQLGNSDVGYLKSLASGGENSLINDPNQAAEIARVASRQLATLQGRIGGFQKFQVRTSLNSLNDNKEGLEKAKGVIRDVDYAVETAELNRVNVLMQSSMSLLGLANQQASQVLSLLG